MVLNVYQSGKHHFRSDRVQKLARMPPVLLGLLLSSSAILPLNDGTCHTRIPASDPLHPGSEAICRKCDAACCKSQGASKCQWELRKQSHRQQQRHRQQQGDAQQQGQSVGQQKQKPTAQPHTALTQTALTNLTLYRLTPTNITGLEDKDTGDAAGDIYFQLYELTFPLYCQQNPHDSSCQNSVFDDINNDVYRQSVVEIDSSHYGVYNGCDPQPNGSSFRCRPYWHGGCWYDVAPYNTTFAGICDRANCSCAALFAQAVGRMACATSMRAG